MPIVIYLMRSSPPWQTSMLMSLPTWLLKVLPCLRLVKSLPTITITNHLMSILVSNVLSMVLQAVTVHHLYTNGRTGSKPIPTMAVMMMLCSKRHMLKLLLMNMQSAMAIGLQVGGLIRVMQDTPMELLSNKSFTNTILMLQLLGTMEIKFHFGIIIRALKILPLVTLHPSSQALTPLMVATIMVWFFLLKIQLMGMSTKILELCRTTVRRFFTMEPLRTIMQLRLTQPLVLLNFCTTVQVLREALPMCICHSI
mmetsp:Transcript_24443/g.34444  ORF Transcript_24443/g.34444 Transcript_24443/m.34444 type:complete len:254 (-) Transcript_24443:763-1524(-)